jgi:predicted ATPase
MARPEKSPSAQREHLEKAISLYDSGLLPGWYSDWVLSERERLLRAYLSALHRLCRLFEEEKLFEPALHYARLALAADPLEEEAHGDLIRILAASGEPSAALRQFQHLKRVLAEEFGAEPSPTSLALVDSVRNAPAGQAPPISPTGPTGRNERSLRLPVPLTRFFGREEEIKRICRMLLPEQARLVTLIGTGGAGKTRLSLAVSARLMNDYQGAVAFVPLADLGEAKMIPAALATALNLPELAVATSGASLLPIVEALSRRPFFLVLDNLEHVLAEASPLVRELLECVPALTILATSRQRLGIEGEQEITVTSLPLPDLTASPDELLQTASVQLFVDRARLARPDFEVNESNAGAVARVCARLDGIPLAIELCAAWAQMLTPSQMLEKLDRRFDLLVSRRTDITPRHRTLRAALEYSYLQLSAELQRLFARLSVFRGGWSLDAALAVASESEDMDLLVMLAEVTELRERSLIVAEEIPDGIGGAEMRYRILETLREFAGEQLSYADRAFRRRAHADYFLGLAENHKTPIARLEQEQENLRSVLAWSIESKEFALGLRIGAALRRYWLVRGRLAEGYDWLRRLFDELDRDAANGPSASLEIRASAWNTLGYLAWAQGNYITSYDAHQIALSLFRESGDRVGVEESLYYLGITRYRQDDYAAAQVFFDESLAIARDRNDSAGVARVLLNLGNIAYEELRYEEADALFLQSLNLEQGLGNQQRVANALNNLGLIAMARKDYEKAASLFEKALALSRELGDSFSVANFTMNLGAVARLRNQNKASWSLLMDGLKLAFDVGNKHILSHYLLQLGLLESAEHKPAHCVFLLLSAHHVIENLANSQEVSRPEEYERAMSAARSALGERRFREVTEQARSATLRQIVLEVLSWQYGPDDAINCGEIS